MTQQPSLDLSPFQLFVPVPPMLSEALGYTGEVFGHTKGARYVGFYWERAGDEANYDDGRSSGTGEYTGYLAFVRHRSIAVHLRHYDFGSSETRPRHMLLLDRTEEQLYALPFDTAQHFLCQQWSSSNPAADKQPEAETIHVEAMEDLAACLSLINWQEIALPDDFEKKISASMQQTLDCVKSLITWLDHAPPHPSPERIAELEADAPALLLSHIVGNSPEAFARMGEMVHIQEVLRLDPEHWTVTFYRDNGIDGPDPKHLFSVEGNWARIMSTLEVLIFPATLDDLLDEKADFASVIGRHAAWNGQAFPIVEMNNSLAIRVHLACARCGRNAMTAWARSGLDRGAFCYVYDAAGNYQANLRDQAYVCSRCSSRSPSSHFPH